MVQALNLITLVWYSHMQDDMKKVGILTTFHLWSEAYSLTGVVKHQLIALLKHGYKPVLFLLEIFPDDQLKLIPKGVEVRKVIPQIIIEPYKGVAASRNVPQQFEKDVAKLVPAFNEHFKDIDIMLCHDIIFQDSFLAHNGALRKMVMRKDQKFFHWMHSGPSKRPDNMQEPISFLYSLPPQSTLIYMNSYEVAGAAEMYNVFPTDVRVVHNPIDDRMFPNIHTVVKNVIEKGKLYDADIVGVYPLSTTRMGEGGKQLHKAIKIMGYLKNLGNKVKYIVANAHANGDQEKAMIEEMLMMGKTFGLEPMKDLIFTSFITPPKYEHGIPHEAVIQLFQLSDIFLFPSYSENCPLILLEAALAKNLLVLNEDFTPMKDFVGPHALYFKFDSRTTNTNHPQGEDVYYKDIARIISAELQRSKIWQSHREVRQKFNLDYMFQKELEPLFYEEGKAPIKKEKKKEAPKIPSDPLKSLKEKYGWEL